MAAKKSASGGGLLDELRNHPQTKRLTDEARNLLGAQSDRLSQSVGGLADKLTDIGEGGGLGSLGEGAKRMMQGESPLHSALGAAGKGITDKVSSLFGGGKGKHGGAHTKTVDIEEQIDIGVPVSVAYNQWTQFTEFGNFTKGVESVNQDSDTETTWRAKVFRSRRSWKATITEQVPDDRIAWTSEGDKGTVDGVVTFHRLADNLTRVLLTLEYHPKGFVEKTGNLWRAAGRRARLDLKNFRRFVTQRNEPTGKWRGEIHDGEVAKNGERGERGRRTTKGQGRERTRGERTRGERTRGGRRGERRHGDRTGRRRRREGGGSEGSDLTDSTGNSASTGTSDGGGEGAGDGASRRRPRKEPAQKAAARKDTPRKTAARKDTPRKAAALKDTPRKAATRKDTPRKDTPRKTAARKDTPRKDTPRKAATRKDTPRKAAPSKRAPKAPSKAAARKASPRKATAKKASPRKATPRKQAEKAPSKRAAAT